jgi:hypothetical protein
LRPVECGGLIRLGQACDGGYVVPAAAVDQAEVLLSLGLNDEWSFDRAFLACNKRARLIAVDHTVGPGLFALKSLRCGFKVGSYSLLGNAAKLRKNRHDLSRAVDYFKLFRDPHRHIIKKVAGSTGRGQVSVADLLKIAQPAAPRSVFLKIDIEGAEYEVVGDIVDHADKISCIAGEFHNLDTGAAQFNEAVRRLQRAFHIVHIHGNNFDRRRFDGFPPAVELTLINKALLPGAPRPSSKSYPVAGLDVPNYADRPECELRFD